MTSLFERLAKGRPAEPAPKTPHSDAQKMLDWLQRWPKPTISSRDIRIWGPGAIRNRESAIRSAQILVAHGWLVPLAARRWKVVREPLTPNP